MVGGTVARLWNTKMHTLRGTLTGHELSVICCAFSPDGRTLVTGSDDRTIRLWHVATGQPLLTLEGHTGQVRYVAFYPDGRRLLSAGTGADGRGEFFIWSAAVEAKPQAMGVASSVPTGCGLARNSPAHSVPRETRHGT
jgi:WD40 repeat protein